MGGVGVMVLTTLHQVGVLAAGQYLLEHPAGCLSEIRQTMEWEQLESEQQHLRCMQQDQDTVMYRKV